MAKKKPQNGLGESHDLIEGVKDAGSIIVNNVLGIKTDRYKQMEVDDAQTKAEIEAGTAKDKRRRDMEFSKQNDELAKALASKKKK